MDLFQLACVGLVAVFAWSQEIQNCGVDTSPSIVGTTEDATALAGALNCSNGDFVVEWVGDVFVEKTLYVTGGTSLNITGAASGAVADGGGITQLFFVDDGSRLHLSDIILTNGNAADGGAIYATQSSLSFSGYTSFISNHAFNDGGAIHVREASTVSWDGDGIEFGNNSASDHGGAIYAFFDSNVRWDGDSTQFSSNSASGGGGAIYARSSTVLWVGDRTQFLDNNSSSWGGAIFAYDSSTVSWDGSGTHFSSNSAGVDGGAIYAHSSTVSWVGDQTQFINNSAYYGGATYASDSSTVSWDGNGTEFGNNSASSYGGAIFASSDSNVRWDGNGTHFSSNSAGTDGGAIYARSSTASWVGDHTQFINNSASWGGAIYARESSTVSWDGNGTKFMYNSVFSETAQIGNTAWAGNGGAIYAKTSSLDWHGNNNEFISNSANGNGGAIFVYSSSSLVWEGDSTEFSFNSVDENGGAIFVYENSTASWYGDDTRFSSNSAAGHGGATWVSDEAGSDSSTFASLSWSGSTGFDGNVAGEDGGAMAMIFLIDSENDIVNAIFRDNSASNGGAVSLWNSNGLVFENVTFQNNSASGDGGAVVAYGPPDETGIIQTFSDSAAEEDRPVSFWTCTFSDNKASGAGGAVMTLAGKRDFRYCTFEDNLADVGGAMRLGGTEVVHQCSFLSNLAYTRGLAIDAVGSANISGSTFDGNDLYCSHGSYRHDTEGEGPIERFQIVCSDSLWAECFGCTLKSNVTPTCEAPLEHTTADEDGGTLETLSISRGWWRATSDSDNILACYNADACVGGVLLESYCATGYKGPYCAVCEADYSPSLAHTCTLCSSSRRQGLIAATVIAASVGVFVFVALLKFLLSTEIEESNTGCFYRRVLRAVPLQALKIIVVVWQILTQFADAANVTYPGVYQDFLSAIDVINFDLSSMLAAGCLWRDIDFHDRLLVSTIGPLVIAGFLAITYRIAMRRNGTVGQSAVAEKIRHKHQTAVLLVTFLIYSSVSSTVFQTFACDTLDDDVEYLRADYRIYCRDAKHKAFEAYAGVMVVLYPVGIPLLYAVLLFQHRDVLADSGADKTVAQPISGLWESYRPERFYYEVVECGRRVLLTGVVVFMFPDDAAQIAITMLTAFVFSLVFEILSPYKSESDTWLSRGGHVIVFLSMFDLLLLRVDVSRESDQSQAVFAGVLVAGHVMMVLAIVAEVVGICYASGRKQVVKDAVLPERPRTGSDDVPVFESAPSSWKSFVRQVSVSEKSGPSRSVARTVFTADTA